MSWLFPVEEVLTSCTFSTMCGTVESMFLCCTDFCMSGTFGSFRVSGSTDSKPYFSPFLSGSNVMNVL